MKMLHESDPRIDSHKNFDQEKFEDLIKDNNDINKNFEMHGLKKYWNESLPTDIENICFKIIDENPEASENILTGELLKKISLTKDAVDLIEKKTMGQCDNELWFIVRKGRLTASKHHEIFTKMNSVIRLTGEIERQHPWFHKF